MSTEIMHGDLTKEKIVNFLESDEIEARQLFDKAFKVKNAWQGNVVHFRGLIELSNICSKNCYYCGIRNENNNVIRYDITDKEVIEAARFAYQNRYGSIVIQSGEVASKKFGQRIEYLIKEIKKISNGKLGITLSLGEQSKDTYRRWFDAGAHRYLLRIESSSEKLYKKLHPNDPLHDYSKRISCLENLKNVGYQTGTGVMIGLPFQTFEDLADDLLFMKDFGVHMVGMGPFIEHSETPLYQFRHELLPLKERYFITLKMIALLRILMPKINIASATALQAIDKMGREKALKVGANIIMPNITPGKYRDDYSLYENKPCTDENADDCLGCLEARLSMVDHVIGYNEWGDSLEFLQS